MVIEVLLYELVNFYPDRLNAPRWLQTLQGRVKIHLLMGLERFTGGDATP